MNDTYYDGMELLTAIANNDYDDVNKLSHLCDPNVLPVMILFATEPRNDHMLLYFVENHKYAIEKALDTEYHITRKRLLKQCVREIKLKRLLDD